MGDDWDDRGEFSSPDLPDVKIGHERIAIAFHRPPDFFRQIGRGRSAIEQNPARVPQQSVSPRENNPAPDQSDHRIKPRPAKEFAAGQRDNCQNARERICEHVQIGRAEIQVTMMNAAMTLTFRIMLILEEKGAAQIHRQPQAGDADRFIEMNGQRNE